MRKEFLKIIAMASMFDGVMYSGIDKENERVNKFPQFKPKNKGYRNYQFDENGNYNTNAILKNEIVFTCNAKSDSDAIRKFNEFKNT